MRTGRQLGGACLAEHLAARVEQDGERLRARGARRALARPAPAGGPSRRPRRTGVSSTLRCRPRPQRRRSWTRTSTRPRSCVRPGMLSDSGPSTIAGKRQTTSISRVMASPSPPRRRRRGVASSVSRFAPLPCRDQRGRRRSRRAAGRASTGAAPRSRMPSSTTISPRSGREGRDDLPDRGHVELPHRAAADHVDLGLAGPVHVRDGAEDDARGITHRRPDDLVPVGGPARGRPNDRPRPRGTPLGAAPRAGGRAPPRSASASRSVFDRLGPRRSSAGARPPRGAGPHPLRISLPGDR